MQKSLKDLQEKCLNFGSRCVQRLKDVFHSIRASSEKFSPSAENLPGTLEHIEGEVDALDEVIAGHADFCALVASRGTATAFLKAGCTHGKIVNKPNLASLKTEVEKNSNLQKSLKDLQEKCLNFGSRCVQRLKDVFHSIRASSEKFSPSAENLPGTLEHIEGEVDALDEVIAGHADFCALVASRGTATAFLKAGCTHGKIVNKPNFSLSVADLIDIPSLARSIGNRFMTQIWVNGGRRMASDEARSHLKPVRNLYLLLLPSP